MSISNLGCEWYIVPDAKAIALTGFKHSHDDQTESNEPCEHTPEESIPWV